MNGDRYSFIHSVKTLRTGFPYRKNTKKRNKQVIKRALKLVNINSTIRFINWYNGEISMIKEKEHELLTKKGLSSEEEKN